MSPDPCPECARHLDAEGACRSCDYRRFPEDTEDEKLLLIRSIRRKVRDANEKRRAEGSTW